MDTVAHDTHWNRHNKTWFVRSCETNQWRKARLMYVGEGKFSLYCVACNEFVKSV